MPQDFRLSFPQAPKYPIRAVLNFFKNLRRYSQLKVHHQCRVQDGFLYLIVTRQKLTVCLHSAYLSICLSTYLSIYLSSPSFISCVAHKPNSYRSSPTPLCSRPVQLAISCKQKADMYGRERGGAAREGGAHLGHTCSRHLTST